MPKQQIIWTLLPKGSRESEQKLKLSVFVSPRLSFDGDQRVGKLEAFRDFLDWPARLKQFTYKVIVDDESGLSSGVSVPARVITQPLPDSILWKALFNEKMLVRARVLERVREPVSSYPASKLMLSLEDSYGAIGKDSPYRPPSNATLVTAFRELHRATALVPADGQTPMRDRLMNTAALAGPDLQQLSRDLGDALLRHDPDTPFTEKLGVSIALAGRIARSASTKDAVHVVPKSSDPATAFAQFAAFHRRASSPPGGTLAADIADDPKDYDFHQILSALGEYPQLLRRLGLVVDLEILAAGFPQSQFGRLRQARVEPVSTSPAPDGEAYCPATKYLFDVRTSEGPLPFSVFSPAPRGAGPPPAVDSLRNLEIVGGLLNLRIPHPSDATVVQFGIIQIDLDGAVAKVINAVEAVAHEVEPSGRPVDGSKEAGAPAFRTSGLSLVRTNLADAMVADIHKAGEHEAAFREGERTVFFAEDLVRGYRIDVRRLPPDFPFQSSTLPPMPPWLSLHKRTGTFTIRRPGASDIGLSADEEGFIQPAFAQDTKSEAAGAVSPLYINESLFHWQGWSLSAPPPANPVELASPDANIPPANPSALPQAEIEFEATPGSLPRLRFGQHYQLRARIVDLAGNALSLEQANDVLAALENNGRHIPFLPARPQEFRYLRYEPIPVPEFVLREELTEGEAVDVLVIRSNGTMSSAAYAASLDDPKYKGVSERHVVPPKAAQNMVERHGLLDGAFGPFGTPGRLFSLCKRESGTLNDPFVFNIATGEPEFLPDQVIVNSNTERNITIPNGILPVGLQGKDTNGYAVHYEEQLRLPYLPDPLARGAALFSLPGVVGEIGQFNQAGDLIFSGSDSQTLPQDAIEHLGFVTKIDYGPSKQWPEILPFRLQLDDLDGNTGRVRPQWDKARRVLTMRLAPGETRTISVSSFPSQDDVALFGLHAWWTRRLGSSVADRELLNTAQHGALAMLSPARKVRLIHAVQQPVRAPFESPSRSFGVKNFDHDTVAYIQGSFIVHALSTAKLDLMATWSEPGEGPGGAGRRTVTTHVFEVPIHLEGSLSNESPDQVPIAKFNAEIQRVEFQAPASDIIAKQKKFLARHEFGDTKFRKITYRLVATTRFREYFPPRIRDIASNLTRSVEFKDVIVPSSASPPEPDISYILPAFQWSSDFDGINQTKSDRLGGCLRVYLGPMWHASGDGEQLAVVASDLGADPLHASPVSRVDQIKPSVSAVRVPGTDTQIFPYDVHYDEARGLWYSDITFDQRDSYFPFVKLTLARYQENSRINMHLSSIVQAGIHQLAPNRQASLLHNNVAEGSTTKRKITITIFGSEPHAARLPAAQRSVNYRIEVSLEERDKGPPDEDLGWTLASAEQQPVADGEQQPVVDSLPPSDQKRWTGHVMLPPRFPAERKERRIVIREFELFSPNQPSPGQDWIGEAPGGPSRRLVYADAIVV